MQSDSIKTLVDALTALRNCASKGITFISSGNEEDFLSYKDLFLLSRARSQKFRQAGLKETTEVVIPVGDNKTFLIDFWACILGGIIPVPVAIGSIQEQIKKYFGIWAKMNNPHFLDTGKLLQKLKAYSDEHQLQDVFLEMNQKTVILNSNKTHFSEPYFKVEPSEIAYIQYSSGSTGNPKGVVLSHQNLMYNVSDIISRSKITNDDSMLSWMPLSHDMGLICFHLTGVIAGIDQYLMPTSLFIRRPALWLEKASKHKISLLYSPNFGFHYLMNSIKSETAYNWDLSNIRLIYNGAEPISAPIIARFRERLSVFGMNPNSIYPGYGLAEASVAVTLPVPGDDMKIYRLHREHLRIGDRVVDADDGIPFVTVGRPIDHCSVRIADNEDVNLTSGTVGHIQIKGQNVMNRYYNDTLETNSVFTADDWLKTGDLGFIRDSQLVVTGRHKNLIIINGQNYYPQDIENALIGVHNIDLGKVVACGVRTGDDNAEGLVVFILFKGKTSNFSTIIDDVNEQLNSHFGLIPFAIVPVRKIPKTTSGKVQHFLLKTAFERGDYDTALSEIKSAANNVVKDHIIEIPIVNRLNLILSKFLGVKSISNEDSFFALGLNSLQLTQLALIISDTLNIDISVGDLMEHSDLVQLSAWMDNMNSSSRPVLTNFLSPKDSYKASSSQRRFWLMENAFPNQSASNLSIANKIVGPLDISSLQNAFDIIVRRHDSLRATFVWNDDDVWQVVDDRPGVRPKLEFSDKRSELYNDTLISSDLEKIVNLKFDLKYGPLTVAKLWRVSNDTHLLIFVFHHIIFDGWSFGVFSRELKTLYNCMLEGKASPLKPLAATYRQFVEDQDLFAKSDSFQKQREYWMEEFSGELPRLDLPTKTPRPALRTFNGKSITKVLPGRFITDLYKASSTHETTPFVTIITILNVLLHKYSGQHDIIIGTDLSGRASRRYEDMIGHFLSMVGIRLTFNDQTQFDELLSKTHKKLTKAFQNQLYPFDQIVADLGLKSDLSRSPIFDVLVLFHDFDYSFDLPQLDSKTESYKLSSPTNQSLFDLQFDFYGGNDELTLQITYNTDIFEDKQAQQLLSKFVTLSDQVFQNTKAKINEYSILSENEYNRVQSMSEGELRTTTTSIIDQYELSILQSPDAIALIEDDLYISYQMLDDKVLALARRLQSLEIGKGDKVALLAPRSHLSVVALLAILKVGAVYIPIDTKLPSSRVEFMLLDSKPKLILVSDTDHYNLSNIATDIELIEREDVKDFSQVALNDIDYDDDQLAYIMYTSGSTGKPKGVSISRASLADYSFTFSNYFKLSKNDKVVHQSSLSFDVSIEEIFPALTSSSTVLISQEDSSNTEYMAKLIKKHCASILSSTPGVLRELNQYSDGLTSLRTVVSGGEELVSTDINKLIDICSIYNTYGPTETTVCATYYQISKDDDVISLGRPIVNRQVYVMDHSMQLTPEDVRGEIYIGGEGVAQGYINRDKETRDSFLSHPFVSGKKLYKTGDYGRWRDGKLEFLGRIDEQVKLRGYRIELEEIKQAMLSHSAIKDAEVLARNNQEGDTLLVAYYTLSYMASENSIRKYLAELLPYYMMPAIFQELEKFPTLSNQKKDKSALSLIDTPKKRQNTLTFVEEELLKICREVLQKPSMDEFSNFFEYGGNSIKATQVISRVHKYLGLQIGIKDLFVNPTVSLLSKVLDKATDKYFDKITTAEHKELYQASIGQKRLYFLHKFNEESFANNLSWSYELRGGVDPEILKRVIDSLVSTYESFRTLFVLEDNQVFQKVMKSVPSSTYYEYTDLNHDSSNVVLQDIVQKHEQYRFDLDRAPLIHCKLVKVGHERFILLVAIHHIISDAWSMNLVVKNINELYSSYLQGQNTPLPLNKLQYKDFSEWHNQWLANDGGRQDRNFWKERLLVDIKPLTFIENSTLLPENPVEGNYISALLDSEVSAKIKNLQSEKGVSLYVFLASLVSLLYYKDTGVDDFWLGTTVAGRPHYQLEDQVGFFVNTLPLRITIDKNKTTLDFINSIREESYNCLNHQLFPYPFIKELGYKDKPLINVIVSSLNIDKNYSIPKFDGVEVENIGSEFLWRHDFEMTLALEAVDDKLELMVLHQQVFQSNQLNDTIEKILSMATFVCENLNEQIADLLPDSQHDALQSISTEDLENLLDRYL